MRSGAIVLSDVILSTEDFRAYDDPEPGMVTVSTESRVWSRSNKCCFCGEHALVRISVAALRQFCCFQLVQRRVLCNSPCAPMRSCACAVPCACSPWAYACCMCHLHIGCARACAQSQVQKAFSALRPLPAVYIVSRLGLGLRPYNYERAVVFVMTSATITSIVLVSHTLYPHTHTYAAA